MVACCGVGGTECSSTCMGSFEGGCHYLHYFHHSLAPGTSGTITSWQIDEETVEAMADFILGAVKSLQMMTAVMKLKDTCSLEGKL